MSYSDKKDIKGFEGRYAITRDGKVWSYPNLTRSKGGWLKLRGSGRKYLKVLPDEKRKYKTISLRKNFKPYYFYVHRLVAQTYIQNPKNLPEVNHINGDKTDNRVKNLEWCTHKENVQHAFENGLTTRGERNSQTKLTPKEVLEIRNKYKSKPTPYIKLANIYGVTESNIGLIIRGKNWAWL